MSTKRTAAFGAGVLSALLVGGIAFAPVASAQEVEDEATALQAEGLVDITPVPHVVGSGKDSLIAADLPPDTGSLLHAGVFNAFAEDGHANASTADVRLTLPGAPEIEASLIVADCENLQGSTSIANLRVGDQEIKLDQIQPNQELIPDPLVGVARITLNKQDQNDDGSLSVTALAVDLLNGTQTLDLSKATCTEGDSTEPTDPAEPTDPTDPADPTVEPTDPGEDDGGDNDNAGDRADENGNAPTPVPQPGHLDVTG
ncbi:hypothetical protein FHU38_000389 [Saccharomonospora amisosensis]|uniref:Uncharacterized protein n=1 Tax=Saccharomonospora amisosensis TaxID=1128677 RepID=A0A7X5ZPB2_9PSEU|nr:choice-of-anchor P family protein [Saccharomonospora amisosensis]NIJ10045.1 hypothetical protein [Saccharomonospora amisosensis]